LKQIQLAAKRLDFPLQRFHILGGGRRDYFVKLVFGCFRGRDQLGGSDYLRVFREQGRGRRKFHSPKSRHRLGEFQLDIALGRTMHALAHHLRDHLAVRLFIRQEKQLSGCHRSR
jgi:hypothetical protein